MSEVAELSLPAAAASPQPCGEPHAVIFWWNPKRCEREYEHFDSLAEALVELQIWKVKYPWNVYDVAVVVLTHTGKEPYPVQPGQVR